MIPFELLAIVAVSLAGSFVKSVTGFGYPLVAVPLLALIVGVEEAVVIIAIPNLLLNAILARGTWSERTRTRDLPALAVASLAGATVGTLVLLEVPEEPLLAGLAVSVFAFIAMRILQPEFALSPRSTRSWSPLVGTVAGFCHGAVGVSGPVVAAWLHAYRLPRDAYVLSVTSLFLAGGVSQLAVLLSRGAFGQERLFASALALVSTLLVVPFGTRLRTRLSGERFERLILALLAVSGVSLSVRAIF